MTLIQESPLGCVGFGSQSGPEKQTLRMEQSAQTGKKGGIGCGQSARKIFKIHIHAGVSPPENCLYDILNQPVLDSRICQNQRTPLCVKLTGFC